MVTTKVQYPLSGSFLIRLKSIQSSRYHSLESENIVLDATTRYHFMNIIIAPVVIMLHMIAIIINIIIHLWRSMIDLNEPLHLYLYLIFASWLLA